MKKILCAALILLSFTGFLLAQQGEYQRKSVSFVGDIWFGRQAESSNFDKKFFDVLEVQYIEDPRFEFNELSMQSVRDFWWQVNRLRDMDTARFGAILQETVGQDVIRVLSDPEIQKARREGLQDESDWLRLAQLKGREFGLTEEQLGILMNSAYLYLPYVKSIESTKNDKNLEYSIEGGILWFQVMISPGGEVSLELVESGSARAIGNATLGDKSYQRYRLGNEYYNVSEYQYAQYSALQGWVKNLTVIMKRIPDFCLSAQVIERLSGSRFSANLGKREGLYLDDGFFVNEIYEDAEGNQKRKRIGYARLVKNADNRTDQENLSELKLFYGQRIMPGAVLQENPRLGLEIAVNLGPVFDLKIPGNALPGGSAQHPVESGLGINMDLSYNMAPITGFTQTYWDTRVGMEFLSVENNSYDPSASIISVYSGLSKRMWLGRMSLGLGASIGADFFSSETEVNSITHETSITCLGGKVGGKLIYLLSPNAQLSIGATHNFTVNLSSSYKRNDIEIPHHFYPLDDVTTDRTQLEIGINWIIGSFPVNVFGWLDPLKKH